MRTRPSPIVSVTLAAMLGAVNAVNAAPLPVPGALQVAVKEIDARIEPARAAPGQTVTWKLTLDLQPGWHTYPSEQPGGDELVKGFVTSFKFIPANETTFVGKLKDPDATLHEEDGLKLLVLEGRVGWERSVKVAAGAAPGERNLHVKVTGQVCTNKCVPMNLDVATPLTIVAADRGEPPAPGRPVAAGQGPIRTGDEYLGSESNASRAAEPPSPSLPAEIPAAPMSSSGYWAGLRDVAARLDRQEVPRTGLLAFVLTGAAWGGVTLITPCVFPMIPITVSFFLKQSERKDHRPLTMALVYCLTIITVLTLAAVLLLSFFRQVSTSGAMNIAMGILFVAFALSLFGMYELELPSGLARFTAAREGQGGLVGTMFMALTFTILSFACVAPFLGGFGGTAASSGIGWSERVLGGLAFSAAFASPFFLLALFPTFLKRLPKSGSWLNSVKVVMGFLELAAALTFFRTGELLLNNSRATFFTYDLVLGAYVAISFVCGLYLLDLFRLPHDSPSENLSVARLLFSLAFLVLGVYLLPGLFRSGPEGEKQRPSGTVYAWLESFLLPESRSSGTDLHWTPNLPQAIAEAAADARAGRRSLVFVDFTGVSCKNCALNELNVFSKPEFQKLLRPYRLVQLYTDTIPERFLGTGAGGTADEDQPAANRWFQKTAFNDEKLPLYAILQPLPDGRIRVAGVYAEGKINDEKAFADFLRQPIESAPAGNSLAFR